MTWFFPSTTKDMKCNGTSLTPPFTVYIAGQSQMSVVRTCKHSSSTQAASHEARVVPGNGNILQYTRKTNAARL